LNLDCPGCKSRLKLDPSRLPPGATTAVCPKCRAKILLPGAAPPSTDITVQCPACSARLRVNVSRLKSGVSQSKCPKCGGAVALPSAPSAQAPPAELPVSAQTRRLDPREIGAMLGGGGAPGAGDPSRSQPLPIAVEEMPERSDPDLGRLIDQKVEGLGHDSPGEGRAVAAAVGSAVNAGHARLESLPFPPRAPAAPSIESIPLAREPVPAHEKFERSSAAVDPSRRGSGAAPRRISEPGTRLAPKLESAAIETEPAPAAGPLPSIVAGIVGGAIVSGALLLAGSALPANFVPRAPEILISVLGDKLSLVLLTIALSGVAGLFGGIARPPADSPAEGEPAGGRRTSIFRCAVAAGLMGLIAGVATSLIQGGFDIVITLVWTASLAVCGLLTAPFAALLSRR